MLRSLSEFVGFPAVVALVLGGVGMLVLAASLGGEFGQILATAVGVLVVLAGLALMGLVWIKRMNEDIGRNRRDIERDLDEILDGPDSEE